MIWLWTVCWLALYVQPGLSFDWTSVTTPDVNAIRAQRDVSANSTIDDQVSLGLSLSSTLFKEMGFIYDSLQAIDPLLNASIQILMVDVYYNERSQAWQLCPAPFPPTLADENQVVSLEWQGNTYQCQGNFTFDALISSIYTHLVHSNTNLQASLVQLLLNLKSLVPPSNYTYSGNMFYGYKSLSTSLTLLGNAVYSPLSLQSDRENGTAYTQGVVSPNGYPTLQHFLFEEFRRLIPIVTSYELLPNTTYQMTEDDQLIFFPNSNITTNIVPIDNSTCLDTQLTLGEINNISKLSFRIIIDNDENQFTNDTIEASIDCGFSPVLNSSISVPEFEDFFNHSLWTWDLDIPEDANISSLTNATSFGSRIVDRCAALTESGWVVYNCYSPLKIACKNDTDSFDWRITDDSNDYFDPDCPDGFHFDVPKSPLQESALKLYISEKNIDLPVWIDMNCLTSDNCWVSGGPNAQCPYVRTIPKSSFVERLTPATVVAAIIIIFMLASKLRKHPIQSNRKHWKKLLKEAEEEEYEGVPS